MPVTLDILLLSTISGIYVEMRLVLPRGFRVVVCCEFEIHKTDYNYRIDFTVDLSLKNFAFSNLEIFVITLGIAVDPRYP